MKLPKPIDPTSPDYVQPTRWYEKRYHEPAYLDLLKPQIPFYDLVNVQVTGYDFAVLEEYIRFIQKIGKDLNLKLVKFWPQPATCWKYDRYKDSSSIIETSDTIKLYERNVQIKHLTTKDIPIFLEAIQAGKPVGVTLRMHEHEEKFEEDRYMEDTLLTKYNAELEELKQPISVLTKKK